ncbi:hypothetical protein MBLNU459_g3722t1 [Dothideomycetes sp. NU459]
MTTHTPRAQYSPEEIISLYPNDLALQQVQVLLRHGERTPVTPRFKNAGLAAYWPYCNAAKQLRSVIKSANDSWDDLTYRRKLETYNAVDDGAVIAAGPAGETDGICLPGELTDTGRQTTLDLGQRLRRLYVDQLNFMPSVLQDTSDLYLRCTPIPRAGESVQQTFFGMYPPTARAPSLAPPAIVTRSASEETLFPNEGGCRRFAQLSQAFAQRTSDRWNDSDEMAYLNKLMGKWMPDGAKTIKVDGHPRLSGIMDTINSTLAHGPQTRLPSEFYDAKGREIIDKIGVEEWFSGYKESNEYRSLGIGALMGDVTARMVENARSEGNVRQSKRSAVKFALSGCHDTTLAAVLASMGAYEGEPWPPYTSHIAIELFKEKKASTSATTATSHSPSGSWWSTLFGPAKNILTPTVSSRTPAHELPASEKQKLDDYYVRLRYNDRVMTVPGCKPAGKHFADDESLCTLEAFKAIVDKFTPKNWKGACNAHLGENAFPESVEPAGV